MMQLSKRLKVLLLCLLLAVPAYQLIKAIRYYNFETVNCKTMPPPRDPPLSIWGDTNKWYGIYTAEICWERNNQMYLIRIMDAKDGSLIASELVAADGMGGLSFEYLSRFWEKDKFWMQGFERGIKLPPSIWDKYPSLFPSIFYSYYPSLFYGHEW